MHNLFSITHALPSNRAKGDDATCLYPLLAALSGFDLAQYHKQGNTKLTSDLTGKKAANGACYTSMPVSEKQD